MEKLLYEQKHDFVIAFYSNLLQFSRQKKQPLLDIKSGNIYYLGRILNEDKVIISKRR